MLNPFLEALAAHSEEALAAECIDRGADSSRGKEAERIDLGSDAAWARRALREAQYPHSELIRGPVIVRV